MGGGAAAHVNNLNIVVLVRRKMHETGVGADIDELSCIQHPAAVHHKFLPGGVKALLHLPLSRKDLRFLWGNDFQFIKKLLVHLGVFLSCGGG